jgi:hypothetical protein
MTLSWKKKKNHKKRAGGVAQGVGLSSNSSTKKIIIKRRKNDGSNHTWSRLLAIPNHYTMHLGAQDVGCLLFKNMEM